MTMLYELCTISGRSYIIISVKMEEEQNGHQDDGKHKSMKLPLSVSNCCVVLEFIIYYHFRYSENVYVHAANETDALYPCPLIVHIDLLSQTIGTMQPPSANHSRQ